MNNINNYYLGNSEDKKKKLGISFTDILVIPEEFNLLDKLCSFISKVINSSVYWYQENNKAIVCVETGYVHYALDAAKPFVNENFNSMSIQYIDRVISPVLEDYTTIATFEEIGIKELYKWCEKFDPNHELIVKINSEGHLCILSKEPDKFIELVKREHLLNPIDHLLSFTI